MEKRVKIRKTVFGGAIARICCLTLCLCLGLSISMTAQAASGKKVTPVTMAAVVGEEKTVTQQADKTSAALGMLPAGTTVNVCGQTGSGENAMYQIVYGNAIGYITQTACQPVSVDEAMTAALAAQAEAVKQQVAQAQAAAQQAALAQAQATSIPAGSGNVIFVGDSRTGQMANAVGGTAAWPGTAFVACFGGGVDWLSTAQAKKDAKKWVNPVGYSEHQTGLAVDINADGVTSTGEEVYTWLKEHAWEYGFILRYPDGKTNITGTDYEPWHYRYVGKDAAKVIHKKGISLEEYLAK